VLGDKLADAREEKEWSYEAAVKRVVDGAGISRCCAELSQCRHRADSRYPEMKEWLLHDLGGEFTPNTPDQFNEFLVTDTARWMKVIKETGVRFD